jgi:MFS family permease
MTQHNQHHYRWNFTVNLLDGATFWFGYSFISTSTILPLFISKLTDSVFPIGLLSVIASAGWFLPQLVSARITEESKRMKPIVVGWGIFLERLPVWVILIAAVLSGVFPSIALILFFFGFTWHTIGAGMVAPSWQSLLARIFSPEKRGSFLGLTMFIGAGTGALGSLLSAGILERFDFPSSFIILFSIAAGFVTISWIFLSLTKEPDLPIEPEKREWPAYFLDLRRILKHDRNFRRFVITNMLITLGSMGLGFLTISAIKRFDITDSTVGIYTLIMLVGQTFGNLVLGWMADHFGHKLSVEIGTLAACLAFLIAVLAPSPFWYYVVFALMGIQLSSGVVSGMLLVMEFSDTERIPTYAGLANTTRGIIGLLAPLLAAQMAEISYILLFSICAVVTLAGVILLRWWVREPRWHAFHLEERSLHEMD